MITSTPNRPTLFLPLVLVVLTLFVAGATAQTPEWKIKNVKQLTFGGDNAEAYFSPEGKHLSFQSNNPAWGLKCDQIFAMDIQAATGNPAYKPDMISTGYGRTTCAYYMPDGNHVLYASTHLDDKECPPPPAPRKDSKYLWSVNAGYDIFVADLKGTIVKQLTKSPGYDAEATVSPKGDLIVFTSMRSGDLELWTMRPDGSDQKQITHDLGYDGGAFFSPDGTKLVFRASRPSTDGAKAEYRSLLSEGLVAPTEMEVYTCNIDGSDLKQVTKLGKANWAPFFEPSGKRILFSSNHASEKGYDFQIYSVQLDGTHLYPVTTVSQFNAFPMFSPDGKKLVWSSNRNNNGTRDTNVFIADWME